MVPGTLSAQDALCGSLHRVAVILEVLRAGGGVLDVPGCGLDDAQGYSVGVGLSQSGHDAGLKVDVDEKSVLPAGSWGCHAGRWG